MENTGGLSGDWETFLWTFATLKGFVKKRQIEKGLVENTGGLSGDWKTCLGVLLTLRSKCGELNTPSSPLQQSCVDTAL